VTASIFGVLFSFYQCDWKCWHASLTLKSQVPVFYDLQHVLVGRQLGNTRSSTKELTTLRTLQSIALHQKLSRGARSHPTFLLGGAPFSTHWLSSTVEEAPTILLVRRSTAIFCNTGKWFLVIITTRQSRHNNSIQRSAQVYDPPGLFQDSQTCSELAGLPCLHPKTSLTTACGEVTKFLQSPSTPVRDGRYNHP